MNTTFLKQHANLTICYKSCEATAISMNFKKVIMHSFLIEDLPVTLSKSFYKVIKFCSAIVWLINGLYCKLLNQVPRHEMIVWRILHTNGTTLFTKLIGVAEITMFIWILSNYKSKLNAITQIIVIGTMNILEFVMAPDLLLWGKMNIIFAALFMLLIAFNEFVLNKRMSYASLS